MRLKAIYFLSLMMFVFTTTFFHSDINAQNVLYYNDNNFGTNQLAAALASSGYNVTSTTSNATFQTQIAIPNAYDIAIYFSQDNFTNATSVNSLATFAANGGQVMFFDWTANNTFGALFGVSYTGSTNINNITVTDIELSNALPNNPFTLTNPGWINFSRGMNALPGNTVLATYSNGNAAIVANAAKTVFVFGFVADGISFSNLFANTLVAITQQITSVSTALNFCAGDASVISYTIDNNFNSGNVFTAQLSDASGSFASPVNIGSANSVSSGNINITIPVNTTLGNGYRIRVVSSSPVRNTSNNGTNITINPLPVANFNFSTACEDKDVVFTDASTISSGSIVSWEYLLGDGSVSNLVNPVYAYPNTGIYNVTLNVNSDLGCVASITKPVAVTVNPIADFSFNDNCIGTATTFQNNSSNAASFLWKFGDGDVATIPSVSGFYLNPGTYIVTLIATSGSGCIDSVQKPINIYPKPLADFSFTSACPNDALSFSNLSSVSSGSITSSNWNFDDGNTDNAFNTSNTYVTEGTYDVELIVSSAFGCLDTIVKEVLVYPVPDADFNVANVCLGKPSIFNNTTSIANGTLNYTWNFGNGINSNNPTPSNIFPAFGNYNITLTALSNNGCTDTIIKPTTIFQQPQAGFFAPNVCLGDSMNFTNTTVGTSVSFQWSFGDGNFSAQPNPNHLYTSAGSYTARLISTNLNGCTDTAINIVTVYPNAVAAFTGNNTCLGTAITFDNLSSISSGTLNYVWNFGDGTNSISAEPVKNYATANTYLVTLIANSNNGCSDTLTQSFSVFPQPVASFIAANVCDGDSVSFVNNSSGVINTYQWNFGDGDTSSSVSPKHLYAANGVYTVQLIVANGNCADTTTQNISVFATPIAAFATSNTCLGGTTTFTNQSTIANGILNYTWLFGDGNTSINASPTYTYQDTGTYTVNLIAISNNNCVDTSFIFVEIYEQPIANFNVADVCLGNAVALQNTSTGNTNTYNWNFGDATTDTLTNPIKNYVSAGNYTIKLVAENANGCVDSIANSITIFPTPTANFAVANVCLGSTASFVNQSQISNATLNYQWLFGNGDNSTDNNPNYVYDSIGIYTATLVAYSNNGCTDTATNNLVIYPFPEVGFSANTACYGQNVNFVNTTNIAFGTVTYQWQLGDGSNDTATNPVHAYNSLGVFNVALKATSDQGCISDTNAIITVYPFPNANFTAADVCENDTVQFINLSLISAGNLSYFWQLGNGSNSLASEPTTVYNNLSGNIAVTLIATSGEGCIDTIVKTITINPLPVVSFDAKNICLNESLKLTNTSTIPSGSIENNFWSFGDGSVSQEISPTKSYAAAGNYTISLKATSNKFCTQELQKVIIVYPNADATIRPLGNIAFCDGEQLTLSAGTLIDVYSWSTGDSTQTTVVTAQGSYTVTVTTANACTATDDIDIIVFALPNANAGNDTTISKGFEATLRGTGGIQYAWLPNETLNDANSQNPIASPLETITYTLTVTDINNCSNTDSVLVTVLEDYNLLVTNVITPNSDGANDQFEIINIETYPQAELLIFDRWGTEVEKKKPYNNDWKGTFKGKDLPDGTYYYVIRFDGNDKLYKGSVSILR